MKLRRVPLSSGLRRCARACAVLILLPSCPEAPAVELVEGEFVLKLKPGASPGEFESFARDAGVSVSEIAPGTLLKRIVLPTGRRLDECAARCGVRGASLVEYVEPNFVVRAQVIPDDSRFGELYGLANSGQSGGLEGSDIRAARAWDISTGGDVVVAVVDSGVDYGHPDLAQNMWRNDAEVPGNGIDDDGNGYVDDRLGWDFRNGDPDPADDLGHGTHCAGIIGAVGNNGAGVTGVCWRARIMPLKFLGASGWGTTADAATAIHYARRMGARVINASWGGDSRSRALEEAILAASADGVVVAAAAGNRALDNDAAPYYPASFDAPNLIAVAATNRCDLLASFSCHGAISVDLGAPGDAILSTVPNGGYAVKSGTSMAAPHVAGAAALLISADPSKGCGEVVAAVLGGTTPLGSLSGMVRTGGRLNLLKVLDPSSDAVPPGPVADLRAETGPVGGVTLRWTEPPDAGRGVARYRIRYSTSPPPSGEPWGSKQREIANPAAAPGTEEEIELTGLEGGVTYYFAVVAYDGCDNPSAPSNAASAATGEADPYLHRLDLRLEEGGDGLVRLSVEVAPGPYSSARVCDAYLAASVAGGPLRFLGPGGAFTGEPVPLAQDFGVCGLTAEIGEFPPPQTVGGYVVYALLVSAGDRATDRGRWESNLAVGRYTAIP